MFDASPCLMPRRYFVELRHKFIELRNKPKCYYISLGDSGSLTWRNWSYMFLLKHSELFEKFFEQWERIGNQVMIVSWHEAKEEVCRLLF